MFEHFNYEILYMIKLLYDYTGIWYHVSLYDYEDGTNYELYQDMIYHVFGTIYQEFDDYNCTLLDIFDPAITKFFNLCRQYSRKKHQAFQENPFVTALKDKIETFHYSGDLVYDSAEPKIFLMLDESDVYEYASTLQSLLELKDFIEQKSKELESILYPTVGQSDVAIPERRAA